MDTENLKIQIKTFFGLEEVLAEEIKKLGGRKVEIKNRAVNCEGDLGFLYKINYSARTAVKILVPIATFKAWNENKFYDKVFDFPWETVMSVDQSACCTTQIYKNLYKNWIFRKFKYARKEEFCAPIICFG